MALSHQVLVTGANGSVGRHLLPALPGAWLVAATHSGQPAAAAEVLPLDLPDGDSIRQAMAAARAETVIHLAAQAAVTASFGVRDHLAGEPARHPAAGRAGAAPDAGGAGPLRLLGRDLRPERPWRPGPGRECSAGAGQSLRCLEGGSGSGARRDGAARPARPPSAVLHAYRPRPVGDLRHRRLRPAGGASRSRVQEPVIRTGALDRWCDILDGRDICTACAAAARWGRELPAGLVLNLASGRARRITTSCRRWSRWPGSPCVSRLRPRSCGPPRSSGPSARPRAPGSCCPGRRGYPGGRPSPIPGRLAEACPDGNDRVLQPRRPPRGPVAPMPRLDLSGAGRGPCLSALVHETG